MTRKVDDDGVERFDARVSVTQQEAAAHVLAAIQAGKPADEILALLQGGGGGAAIGNVLGGNNYWLAHPSNALGGSTPPTVAHDFGTIPQEGENATRTDWVEVANMALFAARIPGRGRVNANDRSGGAPIEISTDPTFPADGVARGISARGAGSSTWLAVDANVTVYGRHDAHAQEQEGGPVVPVAMAVRWDGQVGNF